MAGTEQQPDTTSDGYPQGKLNTIRVYKQRGTYRFFMAVEAGTKKRSNTVQGTMTTKQFTPS